MSTHERPQGLFNQPKAVWAVAFACVISFMGIGLVDPILPALAENLDATPAQVSLLFTSYLLVTAIAMLGTGWVSSRIGSKWAMVAGLALIVVFAALAGAAGSISEIVWFRGGWGLGNALFISTSLAVIVASARGGFSGAIILYEAALGVGIAVGPLAGGLLGHLSWRGPFFGVAVLMALALLATLLLVTKTERPAIKTKLSAPLTALKHRGLLTMGIMALLYNWGFFTMLGYAPYPMKLDALHLGFVFFAWGILVALFAVFFAPRLQARFGTAAVLYANLATLAVLMTVIALFVNSPDVVIVAVILSGACIGINNTLTTQAVMLVSPVDRAVASSAYGFLRFIGGGLAPFVAGIIAQATNESVAFLVGAAAFALAIPVLASGHRLIREAEAPQAQLVTLDRIGDEVEISRPVVAAIGGASPRSSAVADAAARAARDAGTGVEVVHVLETDVVDELAITPEDRAEAARLVEAQVARIIAAGVPARGCLLTSVGDHADAARALEAHLTARDARQLVIGASQHANLSMVLGGGFASSAARSGQLPVLVVGTEKVESA
ncbi:MAG: MFS transporter [Arachnia sp.]